MYNKQSIIDALKNLSKPTQLRNSNSLQISKEGGSKRDGLIGAKQGVETPIYKSVTVKPSQIEGKGLFAEEPISKGDIIGVSHIRKSFMKDGEEYQAPFPSTVLGYYNHSEAPNVQEVDNGTHILMKAIKNISPGEEILSNYYNHNIADLETPDNFKNKKNLKKASRGLPVSKFIKSTGERIAKQSPKSYRSPIQIIGGTFGLTKPRYFGQNSRSIPSEYGIGKRDLIANYFHQNETGFEPIDYDFSADSGLAPMIDSYGPLKAFILNSEIKHEEPISAFQIVAKVPGDKPLGYHRHPISKFPYSTGNFLNYTFPIWDPVTNKYIEEPLNLHTPVVIRNAFNDASLAERRFALIEQARNEMNNLFDDYGSDVIPFEVNEGARIGRGKYSIIYPPTMPLDNIAGHMTFMKRLPNKEFELTTRDLWSFRPEAYNKKWGMNNAFKKAQVNLMDKYGKPFVLTQTNPITFKKGGSTKRPKLPKGKSPKSYSRSFEATNRLFAENPLFKKRKSRKNKIFDPRSKYYDNGGITECDDRGCVETDQIQEYLDLGSDLPKRNVGLMWDVVDQVNEPGGNYPGNAKSAWKSMGLPQTLGQRLGMTNPSNCMWAAGSGWQCLDETRDEFKNYPLSAFESNDKFISAVNKGTVPFTRITKTNERNFDAQDKGLLQPGDIINIKGNGSSHAMTFSHYREDGKPIYLDSNGDVMDFDFNAGIWEGMKPGGSRYAYVSRFSPEMYYEDEIAALEEQARNNPTYTSELPIDRLPIRPIEQLEYERPQLRESTAAEDLSQNKSGGYIEVTLTPEEIDKYVKGGYIVEDISIPTLTKARNGRPVKSKKSTAKEKIKDKTVKEGYQLNLFESVPTMETVPSARSIVPESTMNLNEIYNQAIPTEAIPTQTFESIQNQIENIGTSVPNFNIPVEAEVVAPAETYGLSRFNRVVGPPVTSNPLTGQTIVGSQSNVLENQNFSQTGLGSVRGENFTHTINNVDYYNQLLDTYTSYQLPTKSKKFYTDIINSIKNQNGKATELQFNALQRLKTGNFDFGKKGYALGGEIDCPDGYVYDPEKDDCVPNNADPKAAMIANPETVKNVFDAQDYYTNWFGGRDLPFEEINDPEYEKEMKKLLFKYNEKSPLKKALKKPFPYQFQKVIADDPNVQGQLLYDDFGYPESILLKESLIDNPKQLAGTVAHEVLTGIMDDQEKAREGERRIIEQGLKPFEEGWGDLEDSDKDSAKEYYDYFTDEAQDNIQSAIFEVRVNKGLKPDQIITDEDIENWKKEAEETGAFDKKDPDYDPALYNLFKVVKDNSALKKWFNYIASTDNEMEDEDTQYAKFGGAMDYEFGDEVDLSDEEAKALMDLGYTLEMVK